MKTTLNLRFCCIVIAIVMQSACSTMLTEEGIDMSGIMDIFFGNKEEDTLAKDEQATETITETKQPSFPEPGERVEIFDPKTQQNVTVIFGETFASASGKTCSSVTMIAEKTADTKQGLVCLNENNEWDKNPMNIQLIQSR